MLYNTGVFTFFSDGIDSLSLYLLIKLFLILSLDITISHYISWLNSLSHSFYLLTKLSLLLSLDKTLSYYIYWLNALSHHISWQNSLSHSISWLNAPSLSFYLLTKLYLILSIGKNLNLSLFHYHSINLIYHPCTSLDMSLLASLSTLELSLGYFTNNLKHHFFRNNPL